MRLMHATAIILTPNAKYEEWLSSSGIFPLLSPEAREELDNTSLMGMRLNATVIAAPPIDKDMEAELNAFVELQADAILAAEFERRGLSLQDKPAQMSSFDLLRQWFDISYHGYLFNLQTPLQIKALLGI